MYLTAITSPIYSHKYRFAICESRFWCLIVFRKSIIKQERRRERSLTEPNL